MKIIWRWNTFKQFQNHQPSIFRPLQEPAPPASRFPMGFGQPQQANNLVITQLGRNMQWIPSFLGPSPRSKWRMKVATQLTNCGCNPAYFKTHKNIQKRFDAYLANPGGTLPTNHNSGWCLINITTNGYSHSHPMARAMVAAWVANGPCKAQAPRLVAIEKMTCVCVS